jgi:hypothetical protein
MPIGFRERQRRRATRTGLYRLRRQWGVPADLYRLEVGAADLDTGLTTDIKTKYAIPQFITWLVTETEKATYALAYARANSNFTYGAIFEVGDRTGIIDGVYLPDGFDLQQNDYVVYDGERYDIRSFGKLDGGAGYVMHLRNVPGTFPGQIIERTYWDTLEFEQTILGEVV